MINGRIQVLQLVVAEFFDDLPEQRYAWVVLWEGFQLFQLTEKIVNEAAFL